MNDIPAIEKQKSLAGLDRVMRTVEDLPMMLDTGGPLTVKKAILLTLSGHRCEGMNTLRIFEVCERLRACNGAVDLTEADYAFVRDVVEKSAMTGAFSAYAFAQMYRVILG